MMVRIDGTESTNRNFQQWQPFSASFHGLSNLLFDLLNLENSKKVLKIQNVVYFCRSDAINVMCSYMGKCFVVVPCTQVIRGRG